MFIFARCLRSSAAVTPAKYELDVIQVTTVLIIRKKWENNGTENIGLVTPTPDKIRPVPPIIWDPHPPPSHLIWLPNPIWLRWDFCHDIWKKKGFWWSLHVDGLVQDCSNSSVLAMELLQSCTKPSMLYFTLNYLLCKNFVISEMIKYAPHGMPYIMYIHKIKR